MGTINEASIIQKLRQFTKSAKGRGTIYDYVVHGGGSGALVVTESQMREAAAKLIDYLKSEISHYPDEIVPQSVKAHFDSLTYTEPKLIKNESTNGILRYRIDVSFEDNLSRMSLLITSGPNRGKRTGKGVKNIVSIFDAGYSAGRTVSGRWEGHFRMVNGEATDIWPSKPEREGLYFIERAVDRFNTQCGNLYNVTAIVNTNDGQYSLLNG